MNEPDTSQRMALESALRRVADLEKVNAQLLDDIKNLPPNVNYQVQFDNRQQEAIWNLTQEHSKEIDQLTCEYSTENSRLNALNASLVEQLHQMQMERDIVRRKRPVWLRTEHPHNDKLGFVLMPYRPNWFAKIYNAIAAVFRDNRCQCDTARDMEGQNIKDDIWRGISCSRIIVADLTENNPNVAYEVGIADHLGKDVILLAQTPDVVFDFLSLRLLLYDPDDLETFRSALDKRVKAILKR